MIKRKLQKEGLPWLAVDDLLSKDECKKIDEFSLLLSQTWYIADKRDFTKYRDISLGCLCEFDVRFQITITLKWIAYLVNAVDKYKPKKIFYDLPDGCDIAKLIRKVIESFGCQLISIFSNNQPSHPSGFDRFSYSTFESQKGSIGYIIILKELVLSGLTFGRHKFSISTAAKYFVKNSFIIKYVLFILGSFYNIITHAGKSDSKHRVLFYSNAHINYVLKSWLESHEKSIVPVIALDSPPTPDLFIKLLKSKVGISLLLPGPLFPSESAIGKNREDWKQIKNRKDYRERYNFMGIPFFHLVESYLDQIVLKKFPLLASKIRYLESEFCRQSIEAVIVPYGGLDVCRLCIKVAEKLNVPAVVLQHGTFVKGWDQDRQVADYSIVWGQTFKEIAIEEGIPSERIFVTGAPAMDRYFTSIQRIRQNNHKPKKLATVCLMTTNSTIGTGFGRYFYAEEYFEVFLPIMQTACKGMDIVVKIHPSESIAYYKWMLKELNIKDVRIVRDADLTELLSESDLVIVFSGSTVAIESLMFGKETMCVFLDPYGCLKGLLPPPYDGKGVTRVVYNSKEFEKAIQLILEKNQLVLPYNERIAEEAEKYIGPIDGRASERVIKAIENILKNPPLLDISYFYLRHS